MLDKNHTANTDYLKDIPRITDKHNFLFNSHIQDGDDEEAVTREIYDIAEKIRNARPRDPNVNPTPRVEIKICEVIVDHRPLQ